MNSSATAEWLQQWPLAQAISNVVIELRMPLSAIQAALSLLKQSVIGSVAAAYWKAATASADHLQHHVNRLLPLRELPDWDTQTLLDTMGIASAIDVLEPIALDIQHTVAQLQEQLQSLSMALEVPLDAQMKDVLQIAIVNNQSIEQKSIAWLQEGILRQLRQNINS